MNEPDYAKAEGFRQYVKACRLAEFHRQVRAPKLTDEISALAVKINERRARALIDEYPDFPEALRTLFPKWADRVIDAAMPA